MKKNKIIKVLIGNNPFEIQIEKSLKNICKLFSKFEQSTTATKLKITILESTVRGIELSNDLKRLKVKGDSIDDLANPFNLIGIMQAVFRFAGIHSIKKNIYLLHGSTSIFNKTSICFGDDGKNNGKTLSSIECALNSNQYIGDEFCFLDMNNKTIFSYSFIPIHLRQEVKKHLIKTHKIILPDSKYQETEAGFFIEPTKLFKVVVSKKLGLFIFPHFNNQQARIELLNNKQKKASIEACITTHLLKLLHPRLDRMQFATRKDSVNFSMISEKQSIETLVQDLSLKNAISEIAKEFPCYKAYIKTPCDIVKLIKSINGI